MKINVDNVVNNLSEFKKCSKCKNTGVVHKCKTCHNKSNWQLDKDRIRKVKVK